MLLLLPAPQLPSLAVGYGAHVQPAFYTSKFITHYSVLRTIEDMYGLPYLGAGAGYAPITEVWN